MAYAARMTELSLGRRIRIARLNAEMRIEDVASRLSRRRETVSAWERDLQEPKASDLARLVEILEVRADWLLFGETRASRGGKPSHLRILDGGRPSTYDLRPRQLPLVK